MVLNNNKLRKIHRIYIKPISGNEIFLEESGHVNYLANVLRTGVGDHIRIFNENDGEFLAKIIEKNRRQIHIKIIEKIREVENYKPKILFFAPIKSGKSEFIIEKCTELGITDFVPIITKRTIAKSVNVERIGKIIIEAVEQSERMHVPKIHNVISLKELSEWKGQKIQGKLLYCDEQMEHKDGINVSKMLEYEICGAIIGPEGGFTEDEQELILQNIAALPISLGSNILKVETAAIAACTLINIYK